MKQLKIPLNQNNHKEYQIKDYKDNQPNLLIMTYQDFFQKIIIYKNVIGFENAILVVEDYFSFIKAIEKFTISEFSISKFQYV